MTSSWMVAALALLASGAARAPEAHPLTGRMVERHSWCSGMAPTPEMAKARSAPQPVAKGTYEVAPGARFDDSAHAIEFTTGEDGRFTVALPPGTWCIVPQAQLRPLTREEAQGPYASCLEQVRHRCLAVVTMKAAPQELGDVEKWLNCPWRQECGPVTPGPPRAAPRGPSAGAPPSLQP